MFDGILCFVHIRGYAKFVRPKGEGLVYFGLYLSLKIEIWTDDINCYLKLIKHLF